MVGGLRGLPRALRIAAALLLGGGALAGCRRQARPRQAPAPADAGPRAGASARDQLQRGPEGERLRIAQLLAMLAEAEARGDWSQAATVVADPLLLTGCGLVLGLTEAEVRAGRAGVLAPRSGMAAPEITLLGDGAAWALSLGPRGAIVDVLERRPAGWVVVASAASASATAWAEACQPWPSGNQLVLFPRQNGADVDAIRKLAAADWTAYTAKQRGGAAAGYAGPVPGALCGERVDDVDGPPRPRVIDLDLPISALPTERTIWVGSGVAVMLESWQASFPATPGPTRLQGARLVLFERRAAGFQRVASADSLSSEGEREVCAADRRRTIITSTTITILDEVKFAEASAEVPPAAAQLLDAVADTLEGNPDITKIAVQGHADQAEASPLALSQARAEAVRQLLVARGIDPGRLVAKGVGDAAPAGPGRGATARAKNRRVSWLILERL